MITHEGVFEFQGSSQLLEEEEASPLFKIYDTKIRKLSEENAELKERLRTKLEVNLNSALSTTGSLNSIINQDVNRLYEELLCRHKEVTNQLKLHEIENEKLSDTIKKVKVNEISQEKELASMKRTISSLKRQNASVTNELEKLRQKNTFNEKNIIGFQNQLEKRRKQTEELLSLHDSECNHLKDSLNRVRDELEIKASELSSLESELDKKVRETFLEKTKVIQANASIRELISTVDEFKSLQKVLQAKLVKLSTEKESNSNELKRLQGVEQKFAAQLENQSSEESQIALTKKSISKHVSNLLTVPENLYKKACRDLNAKIEIAFAANHEQLKKTSQYFLEVLKADIKSDHRVKSDNKKVSECIKLQSERLIKVQIENQAVTSELSDVMTEMQRLKQEKVSLVSQKAEHIKTIKDLEKVVNEFKASSSYLTEREMILVTDREKLTNDLNDLKQKQIKESEMMKEEYLDFGNKLKELEDKNKSIKVENKAMQRKYNEILALQKAGEKKCISLERMLLEHVK